MNETSLKIKTLRAIKAKFENIFIFKSHDLFQSGLPDLIGCYRQTFFGFELKHGKGKPTAIQLFTLKKIREAGGMAEVCYSTEEVLNHLNKIKGR